MQKRSQAWEQHRHELGQLIHTREAYRQGKSAHGATCEAALHAKPSGKGVLHKRLLCNNSLAKTGRQANTSQPLQERKAEMLLNLVTLSCPRKQAYREKNHLEAKEGAFLTPAPTESRSSNQVKRSLLPL